MMKIAVAPLSRMAQSVGSLKEPEVLCAVFIVAFVCPLLMLRDVSYFFLLFDVTTVLSSSSSSSIIVLMVLIFSDVLSCASYS